jgi:TatA/E family protein of Tat protein translocase
MFDIGLQEMIVIGVIALLVFGPSKLPELGRMFGRALREFRRASDEFRSTIETNLHIDDDAGSAPERPTGDVAGAVVSTDATPSLPASEIEPASADAVTATAAETLQPREPFCAQEGSRLFHRRECRWVARIREENLVNLKSVGDARAQGYLTCPVCEPWELPDLVVESAPEPRLSA